MLAVVLDEELLTAAPQVAGHLATIVDEPGDDKALYVDIVSLATSFAGVLKAA